METPSLGAVPDVPESAKAGQMLKRLAGKGLRPMYYVTCAYTLIITIKHLLCKHVGRITTLQFQRLQKTALALLLPHETLIWSLIRVSQKRIHSLQHLIQYSLLYRYCRPVAFFFQITLSKQPPVVKLRPLLGRQHPDAYTALTCKLAQVPCERCRLLIPANKAISCQYLFAILVECRKLLI